MGFFVLFLIVLMHFYNGIGSLRLYFLLNFQVVLLIDHFGLALEDFGFCCFFLD
jgi:hypothetical protein